MSGNISGINKVVWIPEHCSAHHLNNGHFLVCYLNVSYSDPLVIFILNLSSAVGTLPLGVSLNYMKLSLTFMNNFLGPVINAILHEKHVLQKEKLSKTYNGDPQKWKRH